MFRINVVCLPVVIDKHSLVFIVFHVFYSFIFYNFIRANFGVKHSDNESVLRK